MSQPWFQNYFVSECRDEFGFEFFLNPIIESGSEAGGLCLNNLSDHRRIKSMIQTSEDGRFVFLVDISFQGVILLANLFGLFYFLGVDGVKKILAKAVIASGSL